MSDDSQRGVDGIRISEHARKRFKERWRELSQSPLPKKEVESTIRKYLKGAKPDGEDRQYWVSGPWRFVIVEGTLVTVTLKNNSKAEPARIKRARARKWARIRSKALPY